MSIEYYSALNQDRVPSSSALNTAARESGISLEVGPEFSDLARYGFRPAKFAGHESGVESGLAAIETVQGCYDVFDGGTAGRYDSVVTPTFGSDARDGAVAMAMCVVLGRTAGALTYSTDDGRFVDEAELLTWMHELEAAARTRGSSR